MSEGPTRILPRQLQILVHANDLPNTDALELFSGVSDPFYIIEYEGTRLLKSEFVLNNLNPKWRAGSLPLDITGLNEDSVLDVLVRDKNFLRKDNDLGKLQLTVGQLLNSEGEFSLELENVTNVDADKHPTISFQVVEDNIDKINTQRDLHNAYLFAFPEIANDEDDAVSDFIHDICNVTEYDNDSLWSLEGILDKVHAFFASWLTNIVSCKQIGFPIYRLSVFHNRQIPFTSQFMGAIIGIRFQLGKTKTKNLKTDIGNVLRTDHLLFTVKEVNDLFAERAGFEAQRVDLITATRIEGFRFAPISLLFVYRNEDDTEPAYHLVESGTGVSNNLGLIYWGGEFDVEQKSQLGFKPTPYTSKYNTYAHTTSRNGEDPTQVIIKSYQPVDVENPGVLKDQPYIEVVIDYVRLDNPDDPNDTITKDEMISPLGATVEALERLYTLADGFGCIHQKAFAQIELAKRGREHEWITPPPDGLTKNPTNN